MVEDLVDRSLPVTRKSRLPGAGFFRSEVDEDSTPDLDEDATIVLADPDADGLTATALVRQRHPEATLVPTEPSDLERRLTQLRETATALTQLYILDLAPDDVTEITDLLDVLCDRAEAVRWYDHHDWPSDAPAAVRDTGVSLSIGASDEVCTADVTLEYLDGSYSQQWHDLVAVVRDHDLWIRNDARSDDLADYAHWSEPEEFIETITEHGADLPPEVQSLLTERRTEKQALIDAAVDRAELRDVAGVTVGITYGRCSQNEVAEALREAGAACSVVIKPSGGISLRGTDSFERCHEVARELGGGGHPQAAGCKPPIYEDMLDYAHHWTTEGATARHAVLAAIRSVCDEGD